MAVKFFTGVDLCNKELLRAKLQLSSVSPSDYGEGMLYYNNSTSDNFSRRAVIRTNNAWKALAYVGDLESYVKSDDFGALSGAVTVAQTNINTLFGYFTGSKAKDSELLDGHNSDYFATASSVSSLSGEVSGIKSSLSSYTPIASHNALAESVGGIDSRLKGVETIFETDNDGTINKWNEVVAFLKDVDGDNLDEMLETYALKNTTIAAGTGLSGSIKLDGSSTFALAASGVTAGTYTKITVDAYGRATVGTYLTESDIPALPISKITGLQSSLNSIVGRLDSAEGILATLNDWYSRVGSHFEYNESKNAWYLIGDFYTTGENSASGIGTEIGSGGSGGSVDVSYDSVVDALGFIPARATDVATIKGYFVGDKAANADKLDGLDATDFAKTADLTLIATKVNDLESKATNVSYSASSASSALIGTLTIDGSAKDITLRGVNVTTALGYVPTRKKVFSISANGAAKQTFTHNLDTRDVIVQIFTPYAPYEQVYADVMMPSANQVAIAFAEAPTAAYKVVIVG